MQSDRVLTLTLSELLRRLGNGMPGFLDLHLEYLPEIEGVSYGLLVWAPSFLKGI